MQYQGGFLFKVTLQAQSFNELCNLNNQTLSSLPMPNCTHILCLLAYPDIFASVFVTDSFECDGRDEATAISENTAGINFNYG